MIIFKIIFCTFGILLYDIAIKIIDLLIKIFNKRKDENSNDIC